MGGALSANRDERVNRRLFIVVNDGRFFLSHRLLLAKSAQNQGYDVHVLTRHDGACRLIEQEGLGFYAVPFSRSGMHIGHELRVLWRLITLYRKHRPDIVHHVTVKPILYGGIAACVTGVPAVVNAVSGLGYVFISTTVSSSLTRLAVKWLYKRVFRHWNNKVIFQNPEDRKQFSCERIVDEEKTALINGSGVDLSVFVATQPSDGIPIVILPARMLWQKGVKEFVEAARLLRGEGMDARFALVGDVDSGNRAAIPLSQLQAWQKEEAVEWWGWRSDMPAVLTSAHIICLPSYREGFPKVLMEAAACGRPIVTTDVPGCRGSVKNGNGLLVPPGDIVALAEALRLLVGDLTMQENMGKRSRELAEAEFSVDRIVAQTLQLYDELLQ